ncbi:expressed protein, partial [Phakopsora pachyrhizi]
QSKAQTYGRYLDSVRSASLWNQPNPINSRGSLNNHRGVIAIDQINNENGSIVNSEGYLSWSELIRKFLKHNPDRNVTVEIINCELSIRSIVLRSNLSNNFDEDRSCFSNHLNHRFDFGPIVVEEENKRLISNELSKLDEIIKTKIDRDYVDRELNLSNNGEDDRQSYANTILGLGYYHLGDFNRTLEVLKLCKDFMDNSSKDYKHLNNRPWLEKYDVILALIRLTLINLSQERLQSPISSVFESIDQVNQLYIQCLDLLQNHSSSTLSFSSSYSSPGDENLDELHRWYLKASYRNCVLSKIHRAGLQSLDVHRNFHARSTRNFPSNLCLHKRCLIYKSYLEQLIETMRNQTYRPSNQTKTSSLSLSLEDWRAETFPILKTFENTMRKTTTFPRSGSINVLALEFTDLIFDCFRLDYEDFRFTEQLIELLNRSNQLSFQSHRTLRYLICLLDFTKDWSEVETNLDLYIQLFSTSKTTRASSSNQLDRDNQREGEGIWNDPRVEHQDPSDPKNVSLDSHPGDFDSDLNFIETVVLGSRVLIKHLNNPKKALDLLNRANQVLESSNDQNLRAESNLKSRLMRMSGIAMGALAEEADRETRTELQESYLKNLIQAVELNPNSFENLYHLAFAQTELRDIDSALITARKSVEINPTSKPAWHLLSLITSASKEFRLALDIVEVGLTNADSEDDSEDAAVEDLDEGERMNASITDIRNSAEDLEGDSRVETPSLVAVKENQSSDSSNSAVNLTTGAQSSTNSNNHLDVPTKNGKGNRRVRRRRRRRQQQRRLLEFNYDEADEMVDAIQLKMTRNMLIELVDGCEVALSDQQELFSYFAKVSNKLKSQDFLRGKARNRKFLGVDDGMGSSLGRSRSMNLKNRLTKGRRTSLGVKSIESKLRTPPRSASQSIKTYLHPPSSASEKTYRNVTTPLRGSVAGGSEKDEAAEEGQTDDRQNHDELQKLLGLRERRLLQDLWLMSSSTFRRWGKLEECRGAIQEAERLDQGYSNVWVQFGLYLESLDLVRLSIESLMKSIAIEDNLIGMIQLAREEVEKREVELVESLIDFVVETKGWDLVEGWYLRSEIFKLSNRLELGLKSLLYSLELEESKTIRPIKICLSRCL